MNFKEDVGGNTREAVTKTSFPEPGFFAVVVDQLGTGHRQTCKGCAKRFGLSELQRWINIIFAKLALTRYLIFIM